MIKNVFVVDGPNLCYWVPNRGDAEKLYNEAITIHGQPESDTTLNYSKCEISDTDLNQFVELEIIDRIK